MCRFTAEIAQGSALITPHPECDQHDYLRIFLSKLDCDLHEQR
jgi:hypothetical protein